MWSNVFCYLSSLMFLYVSANCHFCPLSSYSFLFGNLIVKMWTWFINFLASWLLYISGWHICSNCEKAAYYMCYTCTYSLCKGCIKDADILCVRGNKGFCTTCMRTVLLVEDNERGNKEMVCLILYFGMSYSRICTLIAFCMFEWDLYPLLWPLLA